MPVILIGSSHAVCIIQLNIIGRGAILLCFYSILFVEEKIYVTRVIKLCER
jgi:hypothetical protein